MGHNWVADINICEPDQYEANPDSDLNCYEYVWRCENCHLVLPRPRLGPFSRMPADDYITQGLLCEELMIISIMES